MGLKKCYQKFSHGKLSGSNSKGERIYHDQIGDLMLRRPNGRPDGPGDQIADQNSTVTKIRLSIWSPGAIRSSNEAFEFF